MYPKLVPLNIPSGWAVTHNTFGDEDPYIQDGRILNEQFYNENLLVIQSLQFNGTDWMINPNGYTLKLGWYPHANPSGCYRLTVIQGTEQPEGIEFTARERDKIRQTIERCFHLIQEGVEQQEIKWTIEQTEKVFTKNASLASGIRKKIHESNRYRNRFYYGQLYSLYPPIYYELTNIGYLTQKPNKISYNTPVHDNHRG